MSSATGRRTFGESVASTRALAVAAATLLAFAGAATADGPCLTPLAANEPLCNPALADSPWPISHHGAYAQGSSALPGPVAAQTVVAEHVVLPGLPITLAFSPEYTDGERAIWASLLGVTGAVVKIDAGSFTLLDSYVPADEEDNPPTIPLGVSGAYSAVDSGFNFVLGRADFVEIFRDSVAGERGSAIELARRVFLPDSAFCREGDLLVGGVILPDGHLAVVTEQAVVGVIPSNVEDMSAANVVTLPSENGADCDNEAIADEDLELVSNSMAADESGGLYIVTNRAVVKVRWDGESLEKVWRAEYASDPPFSVLRLGPGSGSTPSLMGTKLDDDRFVVITDGQELMRLVLMWRDEIPAGWQPIAPGKDPRIACEVPITFGDPAATRTLSEQSVLVRGNAAVVVNNLLTDESNLVIPLPLLAPAVAALEGGNPAVAPFGIERIDWDPETRTCASVWTNRELSIPNGIPTMSAASGLMYGIGQRAGTWGLEGIDFQTGESALFVPSLQQPCSQEEIDQLAGSPLGPFLSPIIERLPASCENSVFAATQVGPDGAVYTGTFQGASRFVPESVVALSPRRQAVAGVEQGIDLANRALATTGSDLEAARDRIQRGQTQLAATTEAIDSAAAGGGLDSTSSAAAVGEANDALARFAAAGAALDTDLAAAESELQQGLTALGDAADWLAPCPPAPQSDCRAETKSKLLLKQKGGGKNKLVWKWQSGSDVDPKVLPDPTRDAEYALCLYGGASRSRLAEFRLPPPPGKWRARGSGDGYQYGDRDGAQAGVFKAQIRETTGKSLVLFKAKGENVPAVALPADAPFTAQLVNGETGLCWEAEYETGQIKKNQADLFSAKSGA